MTAEGQPRAPDRPASGSPIEAARLEVQLAHLKRGINASHGFAQVMDSKERR